MCSSTALQTSLKHIFLEEMHKNIYLKNKDYSHSNPQFLKSSWGNSMKIPFQSNPFSLKQLPITNLGKPCLLNVRVIAAALERNTPV